eukprot:5886934-Pyramimonas_sp.AAC.1
MCLSTILSPLAVSFLRSRPMCASVVSFCVRTAVSWAWWARPLSNIRARDNPSVDRVGERDSVAGVATDAEPSSGGRSGAVVSLVGAVRSSCHFCVSSRQSRNASA